jgi:hypothetical protein
MGINLSNFFTMSSVVGVIYRDFNFFNWFMAPRFTAIGTGCEVLTNFADESLCLMNKDI